MNSNSIFIIFLLSLISLSSSLAQQQDDLILMYGEASRDHILVQWQPMNPDYWDSLNSIGYRLVRVELDNDNQELSQSNIVIAGASSTNLMLPKDTLWFEENAGELDGLIGAMGALMYDTTFQFPKNKLLDANTMRYNFLCYEAQWKPLAGEALGLLYKDTTIVTGKKYRYKVSATLPGGKTLSNSIDFEAGKIARYRSPEDLYIKYDFPTRMPLSMMISMQTDKRSDRIVAKSRPYEDSIVLRWAPNGSEFWLDAIETGFYISREEIGGGLIDTLAHVRPWAKNELDERLLGDDMALVAANNLHGSNVKNMEGDFIQKAQLFENRFGFAVFAAERSSLAADVLGLRFVDKDVEKDKEYNYKITCPAANTFLATARLSVTNTYAPQPPPIDVELIQGDKYLVIEWSLKNEQRFSSYILERSDDGGRNFFPLTDKPIVFLETPDFPIEIYHYRDSVEENYVEYIYRLKGNDSFAETSSPFEVRGMAVDLTPPPQPSILSGKLNEARDTIHITWGTPPLPEDFAGYRVLFGAKGEGPFDTLTALLPKEVESYIYTGETLDGRQAHYFKVMSTDNAGNSITSIEYFVSVPDLIPPEAPAKIEAVIEDDGTVHIAWEHSISDDVDGYWVYFSNRLTDEFSIVHEGIIKENYYTYQIQEKFLNEVIYYVVAAKDEQGNRSDLSDIIEVERPDKVPPQKPIMNDIQVEDNGLLISWLPSISQDVEYYYVHKKTFGTTEEWVVMDSLTGNAELFYRDADCNLGKYYEYKIQAKDDAGLYSEFTPSKKGRVPFKPELFAVRDLTVELNKDKTAIQLKWTYAPPLVKGWDFPYQFYIYKSNGKSNVDNYRQLTNDQFTFSDTDFVEGSLYNYAIKIQFENGKSGVLSPVKSVLIR